MALDAHQEGRLTRWAPGTQTTLNTSDDLPSFPVAVEAPPEGLAPALESEPSEGGHLEKGSDSRGTTESHQATRFYLNAHAPS